MAYVKALHIIFIVSWFAALFYMPRLLIYHVEAQSKPSPDRDILSAQYKIMQRRLWYIIGWPAMILSWVFGVWTAWYNLAYYLSEAWFILKLVFVLGLTLYHLQTQVLMSKQQRDIFPWKSFHLRLWNEVATIGLFVIVFLVVLKTNTGWVYGALGVIFFGLTLFVAAKLYKKQRDKEEGSSSVSDQSSDAGNN